MLQLEGDVVSSVAAQVSLDAAEQATHRFIDAGVYYVALFRLGQLVGSKRVGVTK